jgi:hypothetical protein
MAGGAQMVFYAGNSNNDRCGALICFEADADGLDNQGQLQ